MSKEQFKTMLLAMLFLLSITLTQQLWISIPLAENVASSEAVGSNDSQTYDDIKLIANIVSPQSFIVNFGGGLHTVFYSDSYNVLEGSTQGIWSKTLNLLKNNYFEENATVEEISREQWVIANNSRSLLMNFGYSLPFVILKNMVQAKDVGIAGKIAEIDSILIGVVDESEMFMANHATGKYYRLKGISTGSDSFAEVVNYIEDNEHTVYYGIRDIYGDMIADNDILESDRLIPVTLKDNVPKIQVVQEIDINNEAQVEAFASTFFGAGFDFVRRITETNGSVIYMYGYGQRALKIDETGVVEYREELEPQKTVENNGYWEGLTSAVRFVNEHGGWPNKYSYLKDIEEIERDNKKGHRFIFGYRINGIPVYYNDKLSPEPIEVEVVGKQVIYYKRSIKKEKIDVDFLEKDDVQVNILTPLQIIDFNYSNFDIIKSDYLAALLEKGVEPDEKEIEREILSSIKSIKFGYYDQPMREPNKLIPVWIIQFGQYIYYFDAYNGKIEFRSEAVMDGEE
ncbi:MAG: hypothetical protein KGZ33_05660 [Alkaliphilus sp.]|nr:hypothetical protein [Alkaliphilus sp.]